jgi:hypothetical protein
MEEEIQHCVVYKGRKHYDRVYIPNVLRIPKDKLDHYIFLKTIRAGGSYGHIVNGGNYYYLCLSKNEFISVEQRTMEPIAFRRSSIIELENLASIFNAAIRKEIEKPYRRKSKKYKQIVNPPNIDYGKNWSDRMKNHYIINVNTKKEIELSMPKSNLIKEIKLTTHLLDCILRDGIMINDWVYKGERLDGLTWDQYLHNAEEVNQ